MEKVLEIVLSKKVIVPIIVIIVASLVYVIVRKIINKVFRLKIHGVRVDVRRQQTMISLIGNISKYFIALIALLMILDVYGIDTKSLLASLGIVSLVAGLALQDLLKDIIAGAAIVFEDQYAVGDVVTIGDFKGTVTYVGIKSTRIKAYTGEVLVIANRNVDRVINHTLEDNTSIIDVDVAYSMDLQKVREVMIKVCEELTKELSLSTPATVCGVEKLGDSGITMRLVFNTNYNNKFDYERIFRLRLKEAFDANNIEIPFPQVVVHDAK